MLEILTPLSKTHRVSRKIDSSNFVATPGIWAEVQADGSLDNVTATTIVGAGLAKMVITSASDNIYESHDVEVGRISTLETPVGVRFTVDGEGYAGTIAAGDLLSVIVDAGDDIGKLSNLAGLTETGTYPVVAICQSIDSAAGTITCVMTDQTATQVKS